MGQAALLAVFFVWHGLMVFSMFMFFGVDPPPLVAVFCVTNSVGCFLCDVCLVSEVWSLLLVLLVGFQGRVGSFVMFWGEACYTLFRQRAANFYLLNPVKVLFLWGCFQGNHEDALQVSKMAFEEGARELQGVL